MNLQGERAVSLRGSVVRPLAAFSGRTVHAVAGIGNPERFFSMLRSHGMHVIPHARSDHAPIRSTDLEFGDENAVLMTEKDAVKCAVFGTGSQWAVPVEVVFDETDGEELLQLLTHAIEEACG